MPIPDLSEQELAVLVGPGVGAKGEKEPVARVGVVALAVRRAGPTRPKADDTWSPSATWSCRSNATRMAAADNVDGTR